jgi:hypothetical protein
LLVPSRRYDLTFSAEPSSVESSVRQMMHFCTRVAEPWFRKERKDASHTAIAASEATARLLRLDKIAQPDHPGSSSRSRNGG